MLFGIALATAVPASAADDPTRPEGHVTQGPSCRPGGLVVEVVAGTAPYAVRLATTRTPSGEDEATLQPRQTAVLHTGDVANGETIDGRLEYTALDGSGVTFVDELEEYSFTRPSKKDCDAIAAPSSTGSATTSSSSEAAAPAEASSTGGGTPTQGGLAPTASTAGAAPRQVTAGNSVTLQASGFQPGELVTVQLHGSDQVLATATAGPDGTVRAEVGIPDGTPAGAATVHFIGTQSEVLADVDLRVAAAETTLTPAASQTSDIVPLVVAAAALIAAAGYLFSVVGRRGNRPTIRRA